VATGWTLRIKIEIEVILLSVREATVLRGRWTDKQARKPTISMQY
jgi:hypothetical protein